MSCYFKLFNRSLFSLISLITLLSLNTQLKAAADDKPIISFSIAYVNESTLSSGSIQSTGNITATYGNDGPGAITTTGSTQIFSPFGLTELTSGGAPLVITSTSNSYTGTVSGETFLTFMIDPISGDFTYEQFLPLDHPDSSSPDDVIALNLGIKATDADGDSSFSNIRIHLTDSAPVFSTQPHTVVDESNLDSGVIIQSNPLGVTVSPDIDGTIAGSDSFNATGSINNNVLASNGVSIIVNFDPNTNTYTGDAGGTTIFSLVIDPTSLEYTYTQYQMLDHAGVPSIGNIISLEFGINATDYDGDMASENIRIDVISNTNNVPFSTVDCSNATHIVTLGIPQAECETLEALWINTNGLRWLDNTNWDTLTDVNTWHGLTSSSGRIEYITLSSNQLSGSIPDLSALTQLLQLSLWSNQLEGVIPNLSSLTQLNLLYLFDNKLTGNLPDLSSLVNMQYIAVSQNELTGTIPNLSALINLRWLYLHTNQLFGSIPDLSALTQLEKLYLNDNQLSGGVPAELNTLTSLIEIVLWGNQLTGTIPDLSALTSLELLSIPENQLTGTIPTYLSTLTSLKSIYLQTNQLTGSIPNLDTLNNLEYFIVDGNKLSGDIPDLSGLPVLDGFWFQENNFVFSDFESEHSDYNDGSITFYDFTPQAATDINRSILVNVGDSVMLTPKIDENPSTNDSYQWFLNGNPISGATQRVYSTIVSAMDLGDYTYEVTNSVVTGLTLQSHSGNGAIRLTESIPDMMKRAEIAKEILLKKYGSAFIPPAASGTVYDDVKTIDFNADWIEQLEDDGITDGCAAGLYCPDMLVTKEQLAIMLLKAKHGANYNPPAASGIFGDVDMNSSLAKWIEQLHTEFITEGCDLNANNFCPKEVVSYSTFKAMLDKTFP